MMRTYGWTKKGVPCDTMPPVDPCLRCGKKILVLDQAVIIPHCGVHDERKKPNESPFHYACFLEELGIKHP